jgi:hypothetical protein
MSPYRQRLAAASAARLAVLIDVAANLNRELCELNTLPDQVKQAQLSARKSRREGNRKRKRIDEDQGRVAL